MDIGCIAVLNLAACAQKKLRFFFFFSSAVRIPSDMSLKYPVYKWQMSVFPEVF